MLANELNTDESRNLLSAIDRMREILHNEKIRLPEIVVVGDQSVGKSSVLEAISGIQLPRAQNICTRCPLELRMKSTNDREYAVIRKSNSNSETSDEEINDLNRIAFEVTRLTNEIAGDGTNVSSNPIYLTVYKRDIIYDLTLIDLPGITRNPLPGQADDIHTQILTLINKYIEPSTAIVLHVIPSSVDFTTSESVKLAKVFDPECERQLVAVSKIDKYDKGIAEKLLGEGTGSMKLQLGCVAVLNRTPEEIESNISFEEMKEREKQFFLRHKSAFGHLPDEYKGVDQLIKKLAIIQQDRIRSTFPEIIEELREQTRTKQQELRAIPVALASEHDCWTKFQSMINELRENIQTKVNGNYDFQTKTTTTDSSVPLLDDRIALHIYKFQQQFQQEIAEKFSNVLTSEYKKHVIKAIEDAAGVSLPNFPSFQIIEQLYRREFVNLNGICYSLLKKTCDYIRDNLTKIFRQIFDKDYPRLSQHLKEVIIQEVDAAEKRATERIEEILNMEYRLFTLSNEYMSILDELTRTGNETTLTKDIKTASKTTTTAAAAYNPLMEKISLSLSVLAGIKNTNEIDTNEARAAPTIQMALISYCQIVQKRLVDHIAQVCYYQFLTRCALVIDQKLTLAVTPIDLVRFMKEPYERTNRREKLARTLKAYEEALQLGQEYM
ncbi:hypothetical protein I4U23_010387 [Adineta vaga]|nr:hypothetical protein I4U23_010387 [Adineta vaga]